MADRYLLESGAPDGYLLEDGSGVLILDCNDGFQYDSFQSPGFQSCPFTTAAFSPASGFPWNQDAGESFVASQVFADPTTDLLYAFGTPLNAVQRQAFYAADDDGVVQSYPVPDDSIQAWAVQPPLNAVVAEPVNDDDADLLGLAAWFVRDTTAEDGTQGLVPPATTFDPATGFPWNLDEGDRWAQQRLTDDNVGYALGLVPPTDQALLAGVWNLERTDERLATPATDDTAQAYPIQPPAAAAFDPSAGMPWPVPDPEPWAQPGADETTQAWAVQPPTAVAPFDPSAGFPWTTAQGDQAAAAPGLDDTPQAWLPQPPAAAFDPSTGFPWSTAADEVAAASSADDTSQPWAIQPPAAAPFDPAAGFPWPVDDNIVQPLWRAPDATEQAWAVGPLGLAPVNVPDDGPAFPWWTVADEGPAWSAWAALGGVITTGGQGPVILAAGSQPPGAAQGTAGAAAGMGTAATGTGSGTTPAGNAQGTTPAGDA